MDAEAAQILVDGVFKLVGLVAGFGVIGGVICLIFWVCRD